MPRLLATSCISLLLAACGGGGSSISCSEDYWDGQVGTCLPGGWSVMDSETQRHRGVPEETILVLRADEAISGQFPTVTVTKEVIDDEGLTAKDYSDASVRSVSALPGYKELDMRDVSIDGQNVGLHIFSAQPVQADPANRFYQVSTIHDSNGYTVTGIAPMFIKEEVEKQIVLILLETTFLSGEEEK